MESFLLVVLGAILGAVASLVITLHFYKEASRDLDRQVAELKYEIPQIGNYKAGGHGDTVSGASAGLINEPPSVPIAVQPRPSFWQRTTGNE